MTESTSTMEKPELFKRTQEYKKGRRKGALGGEPAEKPGSAAKHENFSEINSRFFKALYHFIDKEQITFYGFCKKYAINRGALYRIQLNLDKYPVPAVYMSFLVMDWGVSAHWLLTGQGDMIRM